MGDTLHVFISATSGDLGTVRELVKQGLLTMRCLPVEQTNFPPDYRAVAAMLEERIRGCEAVIHLVGLRYGAEPDPASLPAGAARRSYTQMEADLARRLGKKLYVFVCPEDFPYDAHDPEPDELAALQRAYRDEIAARPTLRTPVADREEVARRVRELQLDLERMRAGLTSHRKRSVAFALAVVLLLAGLAGAIWWNSRRTREEVHTVQVNVEKSLAAANFDPVRIKANLQKRIRERAAEEIGKLDAVRDWAKIGELEKGRDQQLGDVEQMLEQIGQVFRKKEASANYALASRILAEKGVAETLQFLESKSAARKLKKAALKRGLDMTERAHAAQQSELREVLREDLLAASLLKKEQKWDEAEAAYRAVVQEGGTWAEPRNDLAVLLKDRGIVIDPAEGNRKLHEAVELCRGTLIANPSAADPDAWAGTQNILGNALGELGKRVAGAESPRLLDEAVTAYRAALAVCTRERSPYYWAMTQNNLGGALFDQGRRATGEESQRLLGESLAAKRAALEVFTQEQSPHAWAMTQTNLGTSLLMQCASADGAESLRLGKEAEVAYLAASTVFTREQLPQEWAMMQTCLARALTAQGVAVDGAERLRLLREAVALHRAALEVRKRQQGPQDWAETQFSLAIALAAQSMKEETVEEKRLVSEAVAACRAALEVRTRKDLPRDWQNTMKFLALLLSSLADDAAPADAARYSAEAEQIAKELAAP